MKIIKPPTRQTTHPMASNSFIISTYNFRIKNAIVAMTNTIVAI